MINKKANKYSQKMKCLKNNLKFYKKGMKFKNKQLIFR